MVRRVLLTVVALLAVTAVPASAGTTRTAATEAQLRAAWGDPRTTALRVTRDIVLRRCAAGDPIRESSRAIDLDGGGHTLRQGCFEQRVLRQDGTGHLVLRDVRITRGGADGPGAGVFSRGAVHLVGVTITRNLAEEPGGGVFSMRRVIVERSTITGNLANDDGGGVYARRGGVHVVDSTISNNLVDGSGGAIASTGDVVVVRSHVDGNTTDGDGGAIYADEAGSVTVVDSTVDGSTADGPGGAIFTLDGDVTVIGSTLNGNRADDRGGAISGEGDVVLVDSTVARNSAVAHVGGGVWARGDLYVRNSTISDNYAEGEGGGLLAAGDVDLAYTSVVDNIAPVASSVGAGGQLTVFASVLGPARVLGPGGTAFPAETNCRAREVVSLGYNLATGTSCALAGPGDDVVAAGADLGPLALNGGVLETRYPAPGSPAIDRVPPGACVAAALAARLAARPVLAVLRPRLRRDAADQRGVPRPQGAGCDIGAVEAA